MEKNKYLLWGIEFLGIIAISFILSEESWPHFLISIPILLIFGVKTFEYKSAIMEKHLRVKIQLKLLIRFLFENGGFDVDGMRCTYHVPILRKKYLQTCEYLPAGGGRGRKFSINKGITGKSFSNKEPIVENFETSQEFRDKMVLLYNYTPEELQHRKADRKSILCIPILDENHKVLGLVYFDSPIPNTFYLDKNCKKMLLIKRSIEAIRESIL